MIWAVTSRKGSPGATTLAALLARLWPLEDGPRTILEADPDGGVLAARWHAAAGLTYEPGLLTLAASRDGTAVERLRRHAQPVTAGVELVAGPPAPAQVEASLRALGDAAASAVAASANHCFVDCGRLGPASAAWPWARHAVQVLLVVRPRLDEVVAARPAVERFLAEGLHVAVVCVGERPFHPLEAAAQIGAPLAGVIADDPVAASLVYRDALEGRWLPRSRLGRSVAELARSLARSAEPSPSEALVNAAAG